VKGFHVNKKAWALIDLSCLRVYAVKLLIMGVNDTSVSGHMGYLAIDYYGKTDVVKPNLPAHEDVTVDFMRELGIELRFRCGFVCLFVCFFFWNLFRVFGFGIGIVFVLGLDSALVWN
jgi:hypothetical protein